uniref:Putative secreted protein n=1 Tax=Amblyomma triste TaxID=251400 RepID=A0A023G9H4_AMBTT
MMNLMNLLVIVFVGAFINVIFHMAGNQAVVNAKPPDDYPEWMTRYPAGYPCDSWANCKKHLCCARMTELEGNKCRERNSTVGAPCSTTKWPRGSKIRSYLGGCPCGNGLKCRRTKGKKHRTCQRA